MVKAEIRSLIWNLLPKYDKTNKYSFPVVDAAIERVINEMYNDVFLKDPNALQVFTKGYGYGASLPIAQEALTLIYYTTLPQVIVPFGDKKSGVRNVSSTAQGGLAFFPMNLDEMKLITDGTHTDTVAQKTGYMVTPARVEFYNASAAILGAGVRMDLIIPFSKYIDTEMVLIPEIADKQGGTFEERVLKILGIIQPVDLKDDNRDQQTQNSGQ